MLYAAPTDVKRSRRPKLKKRRAPCPEALVRDITPKKGVFEEVLEPGINHHLHQDTRANVLDC